MNLFTTILAFISTGAFTSVAVFLSRFLESHKSLKDLQAKQLETDIKQAVQNFERHPVEMVTQIAKSIEDITQEPVITALEKTIPEVRPVVTTAEEVAMTTEALAGLIAPIFKGTEGMGA
jgi:hypothetical protein